ncbi:KICSTOR complex protein ITFG2-like [Pogonomyrmex barbatus]|uniref:KICSTOR complex protein ITFG2-like n=1 Tax=Pogonomyrmex barbatus TaxID=144034 RepID=A0A6I9VRD8_9HYME|nr:KICSTOR complex protein ITFG2-like [Pogonomyrmex barbatus]XP_011630168.1 KICSTOR complex protein ITFG2-like [Pogonomyrmex barbatus]
MRAVSFVKRLQWELPGTVCRHGLTIGDVDNDGDNELVVGTAEGELYIFKGSELWQKITGLGLITSVAIGDIFNYGRNALVVICGDGWTHIFYSPRSVNPNNTSIPVGQHVGNTNEQDFKTTTDIGNSQNIEHIDNTNEISELSGKMECVHIQRIPTNTKTVLIADVDKDGANEMILGLTDRVVRSYRWSSNADVGTGKLVGLNKWECTNQIGTVTLQHTGDGTPTLLVAQPGGTFMRIKCNREDSQSKNSSCEAVDYQTLGISRMRNQNISTEIIGDLEPGITPFISTLEPKLSNYVPKDKLPKQSFTDDSQLDLKTFKPTSLEFKRNYSQPLIRKNSLDMAGEFQRDFTVGNQGPVRFYSPIESSSTDEMDGNFIGGKVILGKFENMKTMKDTLLSSFSHFSHNNNKIDSSNQNNNNNSNNVNQDVKNDTDSDDVVDHENAPKGKPYALATLDGTIMLVQDEVILWAMQVDHQIFALCRLDVTGDGSDEIIACAWDGQTYILDQQRHSVRFQFEEPVRAFCTGNYNVIPGTSSPSLVYNTFNNKIFLYYDVTLPSMIITPLNPMKDFESDEMQALEKILGKCNTNEKQQKMQQLTEWLLYGVQ